MVEKIKLKEINIIDRSYQNFNNLIHIDDLIPENIKVDQKSHLGIPTCYIEFKKSYRVKQFFIIFHKIYIPKMMKIIMMEINI